MSLDGKEKKSVKILPYTETSENFMWRAFLNFSNCNAKGRKSPVVGIGLVPL